MQDAWEKLQTNQAQEIRQETLIRQKNAIKNKLMDHLAGRIIHSPSESAALLEFGLSATQYIKGAQRNGPCPCGSGKRFKKCCRKVTVKIS